MEISGINGHGALQQDKDVGRGLAIDRDGLDADGNLFRDVRGSLTGGRVIGLLGIMGRKEQLVLLVQESSGCCIKLRRVQIFIRFSTEILNGGTIKSVGSNGRFVAPEGGKIIA